MNSIRYCLGALLLAALGGCADATYEMSQTDAASQQRTTLLDVGYALADDLVKNLHAQIPEGQAVIITSFADVDDLTQSSTVGRMLGEVVGSRLAQQGFTVIDIRARQDSFFIREQSGEFVLSRDVRAISRANNAACVVAGTYGQTGRTIIVSARIIRAADNTILSSADGVLPR